MAISPKAQADQDARQFPKPPKKVELNIFRGAMMGFFMGGLIVVLGQIVTRTFYIFGVLLSLGGVIFPFLYIFMLLRLIEQDPDNERRRPGQKLVEPDKADEAH